MITQALNLLNGTEHFLKNLPAVIEAFVQYYGEEDRPRIEECFHAMTPICFCKPRERDSILTQTLDAIQKKYYDPFLKKYNITDKSSFLPYQFHKVKKSPSYTILERYEDYLKRCQMSKEQRFQENVNYILEQLKTRYGIDTTWEHLESLKGTEKLNNFILQLPGYLSPYLEGCLADEFEDYTLVRMKEVLINALSNVDSSITQENFDELKANNSNGLVSSLDDMYKDYVAMKDAFFAEIAPLEPHIEYVDKCEQLKKDIDRQNLLKFIFAHRHLFPQEELDGLTKALDSNEPVYLYKFHTIDDYCSSNLSYTATISNFSSESTELLNGKGEEWQINSIKRERVDFYKRRGLDLGDDYEAYANSPEAQKITPSASDVDAFLDEKKKADEQATMEYYSSLPDYKMTREYIDGLNLVCKNHGFNENNYENIIMCICPNAKRIDGKLVSAPLALFRMNIYDLKFLDAFIMHELNHVYELNLTGETEDAIEFTCGWDMGSQEKVESPITSLEKRTEKRDYELLSEIINELISQDITGLLHASGVYIFSDKETAQIKGKTSYEYTFFIIKDFYNLYLEDIKESRRTRDMTKLFAKVGEENFNELNELYHFFYEHFPQDLDLISARKAMDEGRDNEKTRALQTIFARRDAILEKMIKHTKEYARSQVA